MRSTELHVKPDICVIAASGVGHGGKVFVDGFICIQFITPICGALGG